MIKSILIAALLMSATAFGQNGYVTFKDLIAFNSLNPDDFETQVLSKGFSAGLLGGNTDAGYDQYLYNSETSYHGGYNQVSLAIFTNHKPVTTFRTANKDYFLKQKIAFKQYGFQFTGKGVEKNTQRITG